MVDYLLQPSGITRQQLTEEHPEGMWFGKRAFDMSGKIRTPSGKIELYSKTLAEAGYDPLPRYIEPSKIFEGADDLLKKYPLIAITGTRIREYCGWQLRSLPQLRQLEPDACVEIHPISAKKYEVGNGENIIVETPDKHIRMKARLTEDIKPGVIGIIHGWEGRQNENVLTKNHPNDPVTGYPALMRNMACRISKI